MLKLLKTQALKHVSVPEGSGLFGFGFASLDPQGKRVDVLHPEFLTALNCYLCSPRENTSLYLEYISSLDPNPCSSDGGSSTDTQLLKLDALVSHGPKLFRVSALGLTG